MRIVLEKGDSEEQKKMAEALLANKVVCAIERVDYSCQKVQKSDDEVAKAVIEVVGLFGVSTQWAAVYRVLVDFCGWDSDFSRFCHRMNRLERRQGVFTADVHSTKTLEITFYQCLNIRLSGEIYYLEVIINS